MKTTCIPFLLLGVLINLLVINNSLAQVTSATPVLVSSHDQWFLASSQYNVAMRITITAEPSGDTLNLLAILNDYYVPAAQDGTDIVTGSVRLWYVAVDTGAFNTSTAQFVKTLSFMGGGWGDMSLNQFVADGSALYVTIDITSSPTPNAVCAFYTFQNCIQFSSGAMEPQTQLPVYPETPPTAFTYLCPYFAATEVEISHQKTFLSSLSTGQNFVPLDFTFNNIGTPFTSPIFLQGLTITVKDISHTIIAPDMALASMGLRDKTTHIIYSTVSSMPGSPVGVFFPLSVSVTALADLDLELFGTVTSNTLTVVSEFYLEWSASADLIAVDAYSLKSVSINPAGGENFPMSTDPFMILFSATQLETYHTPVLAENSVVLKGQTNVNPVCFTFNNPGNTRTTRVDISRITLAITNGAGDPITPAEVFSRVAVSGAVLYGETTDIPDTGSLVSIALSNSYASVPVYHPLTVTVLADILPLATATEFKLCLTGATGIQAQDANTMLPVNVSAAYASDSFPMFSHTVRIASTFTVTGQSVAPVTLYPEQRVSLLELTLSHPGPAEMGNLVAQGLTLTAANQDGIPVEFFQNCAVVYICDANHTPVSQAVPPATGATVFLTLPDISLAPFSSTRLLLDVRMNAGPQNNTFSLGLSDNTSISVIQPSDPTRLVFVAGAWPIMSQAAAVGGGAGQLRLSNYPNPFYAGRAQTQIAYYLPEPSRVTAKLYTLIGDQVQILASGETQAVGAHILSWDGRTATGTVVVNGVYLLRLEAEPIGSGEPIVQIRKIAVVK